VEHYGSGVPKGPTGDNAAVMSFSVNDVIAGYRLEELAGRGGMGVVFLATHIALERKGAVKLIAPELAANEDFRRRFQRESKLAASIDHPNVIPVFDAGDEGGQLYVAMRYVEGTDLAGLIRSNGRLAPAEAVELIRQVADALDAAHARGLVHRDVKPANVLLERRPSGLHAYLTDFGLVKMTGADSGVLTRTGHFLGTPDYAAPEQILGGDVDARADVYALACMLYHAIGGRPPFERDNDVAKLFAHLNEPPPSLLAVRPDVPAGLDDVIRTALAKAPEERPGSAGEFAAAAQRAVTAPQSLGQTTAPLPNAVEPARPSRPAPSRRRLLPVAVVVLVLLAAGAGLLIALSGGDESGGGAAASIPAGNLTSNPSFEQDTSGWDVFQSKLGREQASDAPDGDQVARVTTTEPVGEYSIDDGPETVGSSRRGQIYTATAWVKATEANDGERVCISLREGLEAGGEVPFSATSVKVSAGEYRQVRVAYRAAADGQTIGVHVYRAGAGVSEGESFLVDAIVITEGAGSGEGEVSPECDV
jgi:serine/threonine protein kinase